MLIEAAIGDAYAVPFEYNDNPAFLNDLSGYYRHPRHDTGGGRYTDDTEMSTALAEAILAVPAGGFTRVHIANHFVEAFQRQNRLGYSGRFYDFLLTVKDGSDFVARINPDSYKSGAAMRGWVLGVYDDLEFMRELSDLQAGLTNNTPGGLASAHAAALMLHYFLYQEGTREGLAAFVNQHERGPWQNGYIGKVGSSGMQAVHAAIQAITLHDNLADILKACVDYGGDTDTVATIALGTASACDGIEKNLPAVLHEGLEAGMWGRPYLFDLDARLVRWMIDRGKKYSIAAGPDHA